jgi:hypothetical protein
MIATPIMYFTMLIRLEFPGPSSLPMRTGPKISKFGDPSPEEGSQLDSLCGAVSTMKGETNKEPGAESYPLTLQWRSSPRDSRFSQDI